MPKVISFSQKGGFKQTDRFFHRILEKHYMQKMRAFGEQGVKALQSATPKDSGETANAWSYEIVEEVGRVGLFWKNNHFNDGVNIAIILQYGHGTRNGGWVEGIDYINPAIRPIFKEMADEAWKEVVSS